LGVIFIAALALRLALTASVQGLHAPPDVEANPDQEQYELFAANLAAGHGYVLTPGEPSARRPPGTAFALAPVHGVSGRSFVAARVWWCLLSAGTCAAIAWAVRPALGETTALLSASWLAIYPGHFYYAMHFLSEVPFALCIALAVGCQYRASSRASWKWAALAGIAWGAALLTRPHVQLLVAIGPALQWLCMRRWKSEDTWQWMVTMAAMAAIVVPWLARNQWQLGVRDVCTVVPGLTFWGAHNDVVWNDPQLRGGWVAGYSLVDDQHPVADAEVTKSAAGYRYGLDWIKAHPERMPWLLACKVYRLVWPIDQETHHRAFRWLLAIAWGASLPLIALGLWRGRQHPELQAALLTPLAITLASALIFYGSARFRDSVSPVLGVYVAMGVMAVVQISHSRIARAQQTSRSGEHRAARR
jgi:4-amino-4-deoxy-L-arabinose transferase-like glycosyltransferase